MSVRRRRRLGVAIAVPEPFAGELQAVRERFGDPDAALIVAHVTLLPPTTVPALALPTVADHLAAVASATAAFTVGLRGAGSFRPVSPTVFVPLVRGGEKCRRLQGAVRAGPLARELHHPYHPHVTVVHDVAEPVLQAAYSALGGFEAAFDVTALTFFEQQSGGAWRALRDFPFGARRSQGGSEEPAAAATGSSDEDGTISRRRGRRQPASDRPCPR